MVICYSLLEYDRRIELKIIGKYKLKVETSF